jgi:uncharacterized protein (DUF1697 family)
VTVPAAPRAPVDARLALLRGINVGGHHAIPMAELRELAATLGLVEPRTYIQSGNLLFRGDAPADELERRLGRAIEERFGFAVPVVVRSAEQWAGYLEQIPFPEAAEAEPNLVMLALSRSPPAPDAVQGLMERAAEGERVREAGGVLWIHYAGGSARSRLTPALLDRLVGSPVTTRNVRTVRKLNELLTVG